MIDRFYYYEPATGHGLAHDPFHSIVGPRPIGWIGTRSRDGHRNLAPYSFFNGFSVEPPIVGFCSLGYKDTLRNAEETGQFTWNLSTSDLAQAMNMTSAGVKPEIDEFELAHLTPAPSSKISAPRVLESPVSFECEVTQVIRLKSRTTAEIDSWIAFGEVVAVHIANELIVEQSYMPSGVEPVLRGGGLGDYYRVTDAVKFTMNAPQV